MQIYPNRLHSQLSQGLSPFYLIFGEEPQQKMQTLQAIRDQAKNEGFDERQSLAVDNQFDWHTLLEATQSLSLFASKQLIELHLPSGKPGTQGSKLLTDIASQALSDTILVIHGDKVGRDVTNSKWFKALDSRGVYVPCYPLEGKALHQWLSQTIHDAGLKATQESIRMLGELCEGNLLAAKQEIDKLALLFPGQTIEVEALNSVTVDQSRFNVFQLIDVLLSADAKKAVKMLYRLESEGLEPTIVLWALTREWQTLRQIKDAQQQGQHVNWNQFKIWKNRQAMYQHALARMQDTQLSHIQQKLAILDSKFKQESVSRPFIELAHICLLFMGIPLDGVPLE
ncbi:DNA polymerase III subunit delta [Aestuariibacter sp. AA17]|uniref:DNA polymerase III subunit delta n=1 Tax=Fluctibacter corallii TaxID=2984329 RepID=A0ABT3A5L3_9ALTE|nr:DNA polymerase III subunit delta [Aestuariibacter sp. AA17]MCV2883976.1 DNA polymerase III subunit delta [Aestuariibacter sp. AA17]